MAVLFSGLVPDTSMKSGDVKLVLCKYGYHMVSIVWF
jgi:hypothetical protein